jgi:hypothetical protein
MAFVSCADCEVILQAEKRGEYKAVVDFMSNHDWMYMHGVEDCIAAIDNAQLEPETVGGLLAASAILRELLSNGPSNE